MRKFTSLALALAICATANADTTLKMLTFGSPEGPGLGEPGMMGFGISPNGKYVCGTLELGIGMFIGDLENDNFIYRISEGDFGAQLLNVNDQGVAIGFNDDPGVTFNIKGEQELLKIPATCKYVVGEDISDDGSVMVGRFVGDGYNTYPSYSKNGGTWEKLPMPDVDPGDYNTRQNGATYVSGDGNIILGYLGTPIGPACLWRLDDSGNYVADPIFDKYAKRTATDEEHPYLTFRAQGMSPDGHYVLIMVSEYVENGEMLSKPAVYDTKTGELDVYNEPQNIDYYGVGLYPTAIANDRTIIGVVGSSVANFGAFIMKAGERQAEMFTDAFPEYESVFAMLDLGGYHMPSDITADGNSIIGYGWYCPDEDPTADDALFYFMTYVLTRGDNSSVSEIETDGNAVPVEYFSIDGTRTATPSKGINIIRMSDGSVRKVLK